MRSSRFSRAKENWSLPIGRSFYGTQVGLKKEASKVRLLATCEYELLISDANTKYPNIFFEVRDT